jgi:hypothetical protein
MRHHDDLSTVRIAYHGTDIHKEDIAFIFNDLLTLLSQFPQAHFQLISGVAPPQVFRKLPNFERIKPMSWPDYVEFARNNPAHINLAPMLDTPFNMGKSIIKFHDTASLGAAGIYSNVLPFNAVVKDGADGFLADNDPLIWQQTLRFLLRNPHEITKAANACQKTANTIGCVSHATGIWRTMLGL